MSERNDKVRLIDMLQSAEAIVRKMDGVDLEAFTANEDKRDSVVYRLQIIGEAAYNLTGAIKKAHPEMDWFKIEGLRHRIVHDYGRIDDTQIFRITNKYVPPLVEQLKKILAGGVE
jgi:uncharacterized protein with HEPN domain